MEAGLTLPLLTTRCERTTKSVIPRPAYYDSTVVRMLCLLVVLCGCDSLLGIDHVDGHEQVTGSWKRQFVYNNTNHAPIVDVQLFTEVSAPAITATTRSGANVPVDWSYDTGAFSFATGEPYRLTLTLAGG